MIILRGYNNIKFGKNVDFTFEKINFLFLSGFQNILVTLLERGVGSCRPIWEKFIFR